MYLENITLNFIQPCTTDSLRIRIKAVTSRNISDIFPYLNSYLGNGIYNKKANTFTFNYGPKIIILYEDCINVSKLLNETDAFETLDYIKKFINDIDLKRDKIKPLEEMRKLPSPLEVYNYLPKLNCKECGEMTCLAFATKLISNGEHPEKCNKLYEIGNENDINKIEYIHTIVNSNSY